MSDIKTHPANDNYRNGWDAVFGKKEKTKHHSHPTLCHYCKCFFDAGRVIGSLEVATCPECASRP